LHSLATGLSYLGRLEAVGDTESGVPGRQHLQRAISVFRQLGDRPGEGFSLLYLGLNEYYAGDLVQGAGLLQQSVDLLVALGDRAMSLRAMLGLGAIALETGDVAGARRWWSEALVHSGELRDTWTIALELDGFSALAASESKAERAMTLIGAAEGLRSRCAIVSPASWGTRIERWVAPARAELGARADEAIARGRGMSLDDAIAYAMRER
jgi:hypothetical protein